MAKLSILGLYNYNSSVFDGFKVPQGLDRETIINEILLECADLEIIFPSFNTMKLAITNWAKIELPIWNRLYNTEKLEYNPLWNVDADIKETRSVTREKTGTDSRETTGSGSNNQTTTGSEEGTSGSTRNLTGSEETSGTAETTTSKPGFNSTDLVITDKVNTTTGGDTSTTTNETTSGTNNVERSETVAGTTGATENTEGQNAENETIGETLETRRTGNIGVTSSQQLLREERDVAMFSTIKYIVNSFKTRFCILVY